MKKVSMGSSSKISSRNSNEEPLSSAISIRRPEPPLNVGSRYSLTRYFDGNYYLESPARKPTTSHAELYVGLLENISSFSWERWRVSVTTTAPSRARPASSPLTGPA